MVAVGLANHETGVIQPIADIADAARAAGARLHVDAVQAAGRLAPELLQYGDSLALGAHKLRGPKGIGALALRPGQVPQPVLRGGSQERGLRPGTVDAAAAAGFGAAARRALRGHERYAPLGALRDSEHPVRSAPSMRGLERAPTSQPRLREHALAELAARRLEGFASRRELVHSRTSDPSQ